MRQILEIWWARKPQYLVFARLTFERCDLAEQFLNLRLLLQILWILTAAPGRATLALLLDLQT